MPDTNQTVPEMDHSEGSVDESALLDDILATTEFGEFLQNDLPVEEQEELEEASDEDLEEDDDSSEEEDNEDDDDASEDESEDDDDDDDSTDDDDEEPDEIDWEFEVPVKIDGEDGNVTLEELKKGYQTQQHLSKQGRELGEARKAFETEKEEEMGKLVQTAKILHNQIQLRENELQQKYSDLSAEIKQLEKDGDNYKARDKKDELDEVQKEYWKERNAREQIAKNVSEQKQIDAQKEFYKQVEQFNEDIKELIPDYNEDTAKSIREFAINQGIPEELLNVLTSAAAVNTLNNFRLLHEKVEKGATKRKETTRKATPTKKAKSPAAKKKAKKQALTNKIANGKFSQQEGDAFLSGFVDGLNI
jgi:hypothetical protein